MNSASLSEIFILYYPIAFLDGECHAGKICEYPAGIPESSSGYALQILNWPADSLMMTSESRYRILSTYEYK